MREVQDGAEAGEIKSIQWLQRATGAKETYKTSYALRQTSQRDPAVLREEKPGLRATSTIDFPASQASVIR